MADTGELLTRGVANIIPDKKALEGKLASGEKLNVYLGIDPTAPKIHLGHAVPLIKLQKFAEMGHNVTLVIGDFTALIGDTSDKDTERPVLTSEQIEENFQTYKKQAEKILDFSKVRVRNNSEWISKVPISEFINLTRRFSFGDFASRELIRKRLTAGQYVSLTEALYPVLQGYDSYFLDTDIQIGGTDQTFNMQAGRTLQKALRSKETFVLATEFLMGTDGRKMSKTWGNAIWLTDSPEDMYAKIMRVNDDLIIQYFTLVTKVSNEEIGKFKKELGKGNPINIKKKLAFTIVSELQGEDAAKQAQEKFEKTVQKGELPEDMEEIILPKDSILDEDLLIKVGAAASKSEAKRLFREGAIMADGDRVEPSETIKIVDGMVIKIGKRKFIKANIAD